MAVGEQRGDEPAFVGEPEPAAEAPRRDLECGQEPALSPQLDRGLDGLFGRKPVDGECERPVRCSGEVRDVEGLAALEAREGGVDRLRAQVLAAVVKDALARERPDGDVSGRRIAERLAARPTGREPPRPSAPCRPA